jgi:ribosomal protein L7/L12
MFRSDYAEERFIEAFARIAQALEKLTTHSLTATPTEQSKTFDDVRRLSCAGQKIEAIKLFRELTGASLKDAKNQVEAIKEFYSRFDRF